MRTPVDALRSLQRYVALVLGPAWEVGLSAEKGHARYPFALVERAGASLHSGPGLYADVSQPMTVTCYPEPASSAAEALAQALQVEDSLFRAIRVGVDVGRPMRVPLYDFSGVPLSETSYERLPSDFMRVADFGSRPLPDPEDPRQVAVVADIRLSWRRTGRVPWEDTVPVERVTADWTPPEES